MSENGESPLRDELRQHWLAWSALNHLLPAPILRELFAVIVEEISQHSLQLPDLFELGDIWGPSGVESWAVRLREIKDDPLASYLQLRLQYLFWRNDSEVFPPDKETLAVDRLGGPRDLEAAVTLGRLDFGSIPAMFEGLRPQAEPSLGKLASLIEIGRTGVPAGRGSDLVRETMVQLQAEDAPLALAMAKHLGDLCADADAWADAKALYAIAQQRLDDIRAPGWQSFTGGMHDILVQSIATAVRVTEGAGQAFAQLHNALEHASLATKPVLTLNAAFDAMMAQSATGSFGSYERRATLLEPAYCAESYDLDSFIAYLNDKNFESAQRQCWGVLRRQIALGLASQTRLTKSLYGQSIVTSLENASGAPHEQASFVLAVRLLLESGDTAIGKVEWAPRVVDQCVSAKVVGDVGAIADRHVGTRIERRRVAIEILRGWLLRISDDKHATADDMTRYLAQLAADEPVAFNTGHDLGGRSLEALRDVAKARPEFRASNAAAVTNAIVAKLRTAGFWRGQSSALELAIEFIDAFNADQVRAVLLGTLDVLAAMDPAAQMWLIVRPALHLLASRPSVALCKTDAALGQRVLETILQFGTQDTQSSALIFYLRDFDPSLLAKPEIVAALQPVVASLRNKVLSVNSSGTASEIQALLLSPTISGRAGVTDAVEALKSVMRSAEQARPKIALAYGYAPLQMLVNRQDAFAHELALPRSDIDAMWETVYVCLLGVWAQFRKRPTLLSSFSLMPSDRTDPVLVHNWTFASLRFAESVGRRDEMIQVVRDAARQQDILRNAIDRALVTGATLDSDVAIGPDEIAHEAPEVFYDGLGRRLILMESLQAPAALELCRSLLQQCMRFGPKGLDAAVLVSAHRLGLAGQLGSDLAQNYLKRVNENRDLRLSLLPLLSALKLDLR